MPRPVGSKNLSYKTHCNNGHCMADVGRYTGGQCIQCVKDTAKRWAENNPEKRDAIFKKYMSLNLEKEVLKRKEKNLKNSGWSSELFASTLDGQDNLCAVCKQPFAEDKFPCADHKHVKPPQPRGVLHRLCNSAIGMLGDSPELCRAAANYLEFWGDGLSTEEYKEQDIYNLSNFR